MGFAHMCRTKPTIFMIRNRRLLLRAFFYRGHGFWLKIVMQQLLFVGIVNGVSAFRAELRKFLSLG